MLEKRTVIFAGVALVAAAIVAVMFLGGASDLNVVRAATEKFHDVSIAEAEGYQNVNLGECVESPEGVMGYHYVKEEFLDLNLNPEHPEILVYAPDTEGSLSLVAVEYAVPISLWDQSFSEPPIVLGQEMHTNEALGLYVLHGWIWEENPSGVFTDFNPNLSCQS